MKRLFLAALIASGLALACNEQDDRTQGTNPLTMKPPEADLCAAVRCLNGPCVVKDGKPVCADTSGGGDACKGVTCPNQGSCHVESGKPFCTDACSAVRCLNGPCVVVDGKPVCKSTDRPDAGAPDGATASCKVDSDCATHVDYCAATCGVCVAVAGKAARRPGCSPPPNVFCINVCEGKKAACQAGVCVVR
ncbi:MAG TPA: hypothetical protein VGG33_20045 [Polyangia bacterium]